ncbi:hypothetical protein CPC08DRAFT_752912 [Agrocybe pediades]|nr:hypothetical protein CPC08DRAFT_752912 [Agrocybe pediades]
MKARVLDDTFRHVQDKTLDVVKQVVITPGTVFPTACSAQIEYYNGPIAQACEVEYCDAPDVGSPGMEVENSFSSVESSYTQVGTCPVVPTKVEDDAGAEYDEYAADRELDEIELCIKELEATLNSFKAPLRTRPISPIPPAIKSETAQAPRLKRKHRVQFAMYQEEVPYPTQAERTTGAQQQQRDRKSKKREDDLSDVISQFPDIPAFVPTCPPGRVSPGTQIPASVSSKYVYRASPDSRRHSSASSSSSDASRSSYGTRSSGSDTEQTSTAPSSPDSAGPEPLDARRLSSPVWFADRKLAMPGSEAPRTAPLRVAKRSRN